MNSLTIIQAGVFVSYVLFLVIKFGVLSSISESWYRLKDLGGVWYSLFTWFCFGIGFLMLFQTNGTYPSLFFISGTGLSAVGVATMFKLEKSIEPKIHIAGAAVCIVAALFGIGLEKNIWFPLICFTIVSLASSVLDIKNKMWWIEIIAFGFIVAGLIY